VRSDATLRGRRGLIDLEHEGRTCALYLLENAIIDGYCVPGAGPGMLPLAGAYQQQVVGARRHIGVGGFIQTLTMVDVATGWTGCFPLIVRETVLVVEPMERAQSLFPWLIRGLHFDNDSAFMNDVVVPWCLYRGIEVTRSRAYKKNDQAFVDLLVPT
jgi:hypothetical protein